MLTFVCREHTATIMATGSDKPLQVYHNTTEAYGKKFSKRFRSLELTVANKTKAVTLKFPGDDGEYFYSGTWLNIFFQELYHQARLLKDLLQIKVELQLELLED